jgi:hypothetical protein
VTSPTRYPSTTTLSTTAADGRSIPYLPRRFLPQPTPAAGQALYLVPPGQRGDIIAAIALHDAQRAWFLADANDVRRPSELAVSGRILIIPGGVAS